MKIQTKAVHAGERRKPAKQIPVSTPIHTGSSFVSESMSELDRIFGDEEKGYAYSRHGSPTNDALEEQITRIGGRARRIGLCLGHGGATNCDSDGPD